jgi:sec-independent protein translocase protein TatB
MVTPPPIEMANLGMADSLILMVMALVVFGPRRLPQIGRQIGKLMYEFRKASNDFKFQMEEELRLSEEADRRKKEEADRQRIAALSTPAQPLLETPAPSLEAQADIGAAETLATPSETTGNQDWTPGAPSVPAEPVTIPRIQPPWTGEQVSAARPGANGAESPAAEVSPATNPAPEAAPNPSIASPTPPSETVSQHG